MADPTPEQDATEKESTTPPTDENTEDATGSSDAAAADETAADDEAEVADGAGDTDDTDTPAPEPRRSAARLAVLIGLVVVVVVGALVGWQGYRTYQAQQETDLRAQFIEAGHAGAFALTNVDWEQVEADVQRILDTATGSFYDDMDRRAPSYTELVKQAQSKSVGNVTEAGLETATNTEGVVLASVTINSTNVGVPEQQPQAWRMRLTVQKVGDEAKVSEVEFVQ